MQMLGSKGDGVHRTADEYQPAPADDVAVVQAFPDDEIPF
jgi:hypothetical protein